MKKKIISLCLVVCLLAVAIVGGTMAYFTDTDTQTNTMTFGTVSIEQLERQRGENGALVDFTQNKAITPAAVSSDKAEWDDTITINGHEFKMLFDKMNPVDKIISVKNTGSNPAYVRTIVAIEDCSSINFGTNENLSEGLTSPNGITVTIGETKYVVYMYTYKEALAAGNTSMPSLLQVYLKNTVTEDDIKPLGETWDIIALSQAVQTDGFNDAESALNAAFGEFTEDNIKDWLAEE